MHAQAGAVAKGYIKEEMLPSCIDVVVWGHEHECCIGGGMGALPESAGNDFVVLQPVSCRRRRAWGRHAASAARLARTSPREASRECTRAPLFPR